MKKLSSTLFAVIFLAIFAGSVFAGNVWVKPHFRKEGTYILSHITAPSRIAISGTTTAPKGIPTPIPAIRDM